MKMFNNKLKIENNIDANVWIAKKCKLKVQQPGFWLNTEGNIQSMKYSSYEEQLRTADVMRRCSY